MTAPSFTQVAFRLRNDDGSESAASWRQTQNTNDSLGRDTSFRVRLLVDETANVAWTGKLWNLYFSKNSGTWNAVTAGTPVFVCASTHYADGDDCTAQLSGGSGTFVANNNGMKQAATPASNDGARNNFFEAEWCLQLDEAQLSDCDTIDLRVYDGSSALAVYAYTPRVTYLGAYQKAGCSASAGSAGGMQAVERVEAGQACMLACGTGGEAYSAAQGGAGAAVVVGSGEKTYLSGAQVHEKAGCGQTAGTACGQASSAAAEAGGGVSAACGAGEKAFLPGSTQYARASLALLCAAGGAVDEYHCSETAQGVLSAAAGGWVTRQVFRLGTAVAGLTGGGAARSLRRGSLLALDEGEGSIHLAERGLHAASIGDVPAHGYAEVEER